MATTSKVKALREKALTRKTVTALARIHEIVQPFSPERQSRILIAACILSSVKPPFA